MDKIKRIKELTQSLNKYRDSYYNKSKSQISDLEYDNLYNELEKLETETGVIMSNSPTQTVGYEIKSKLDKVRHSHLMLSLDKTKSVSDLRKFAGDNECLLMCKMDGLTVSLLYEDGVLQQAETRGDGEVGELITHNAKVFSNIPLRIDYPDKLEIEGEAIITYDDFDFINATLLDGEKYKNPRNLCSGSVRQLDSKIAASRNIKFVVWKVLTNLNDTSSNVSRLKSVEKLGFDIVPFWTYTNKSSNTENILQMVDDLKLRAKKIGYPIDGLVLSYDDIDYGTSLGTTGHHPKHSIAYKFYDEESTTVLRDIEWSMGKIGNLTPVAIFDEVDIEGTTVSRASLHNISICRELKLGIGDEIAVYKANMIIPQVRESLTKSNRLLIPENCPVCGSVTEVVKDNETEVLRCKNSLCEGKLLGRISHFVSKKGMDIEGLSEATIEKFINLGWVKNLSDVFNLPFHFTELETLDGFGKRSVEKLGDGIDKSKNVELKKFISALSIPGIGESQSKELCKRFKTWGEFGSAGQGNYDFSELDGFGITLNSNIHEWFETIYYDDKIKQLVNNLNFIEHGSVGTSQNLAGKTFVITGSLNHFTNREEVKEKIELIGGKVSGSVSAKTSYLVNNDVTSTSGKNKKAKELSIPIITEEQLIEML